MVLIAAGRLLSMHRSTQADGSMQREALSSLMTSTGSFAQLLHVCAMAGWLGCDFSPCCWSQPLDSPSGCSLARAVSKCKLPTHMGGCAQLILVHSSALRP